MFVAQISLTSYCVKYCNINILVIIQFYVITIFSLLGTLFYDSQLMPTKLHNVFIFAVVLTAIFVTVFAFFIQTSIQRFTIHAKTAIIFTVEPASAGIVGYFYGGDALNFVQLIGVFFIILDVFVAELETHCNNKKYIVFSSL